MELAQLIETLTGCPPEEIAASCVTEDLRAAHLLLEEAIELRLSGPRLQVVVATG